MKISGFTIIRNAILNDYPVVESITSILPVVDEMIVLTGDSEDNTEDLIKNINNPKIKIYQSVWDPNLRKGGTVLAAETNKAFALIDANSTWAFYIQADEVVHEKYLPAIKEACKKYKDDMKVQGLLFKYKHFYGTYDYVGDSRRWYHKEVRIIRNDKNIEAYKDAQGFRRNSKKLNVKPVDAFIYHYGWVKDPRQMLIKTLNLAELWQESIHEKEALRSQEVFNYNDFDSLEKFTGTHPAGMQKRIAEKNWRINLNISKKRFSLKERWLYWFERKTGIRLFDFRNYKIIR
jgi:hypothetical protein